MWNPQSLGKLLVDKSITNGECQQRLLQSQFSIQADGLTEYITKHQPDVITMPEASIPSRTYRTSALYDLAARRFAILHGYQWLCAHHITGQAHHGLAMMIKKDLVIHEVRWGLDNDGRRQWEGRVLAVRFDGFWLLGVYMPHKETHYRLLTQQITAWMQSVKIPVLICGDMNTVLDPLDKGIRIHQSVGTQMMTSQEFLGTVDGKWLMLSQERRDLFCAWLKHNQLQDVAAHTGHQEHTCYFRAQAIKQRRRDPDTTEKIEINQGLPGLISKERKEMAYHHGQSLVTAIELTPFLQQRGSLTNMDAFEYSVSLMNSTHDNLDLVSSTHTLELLGCSRIMYHSWLYSRRYEKGFFHAGIVPPGTPGMEEFIYSSGTCLVSYRELRTNPLILNPEVESIYWWIMPTRYPLG